MSTIYLKPAGSPPETEPQVFDYARKVRHDLGPEIITPKSPSLGTFWKLEDVNARPSDHQFYTITSAIEWTNESCPAPFAHFKRAKRTWGRVRTQDVATINAAIDAREEEAELAAMRRVTKRLVRTCKVLINLGQALVPASTLPQNGKNTALAALQEQENAINSLIAQIQAIENAATALKAADVATQDAAFVEP